MKKDNWVLISFLMTFVIALFFNSISNIIINKFDNLIILIFVALLFIFIGILFDILGTAVLTADESTFHAKSSKKIKGAKKGVYLIKNGSRISSIFNDVIGDICGIVSGAVSAMIGLVLSIKLNTSSLFAILIVSSIISSLTVGGKAIGKKIAIKNADEIVFLIAKIYSKFIKE